MYMWKDHLNVITRNSEGEKTNEEKRSKKVELWKWSKKKVAKKETWWNIVGIA